MLLRCVKDDNWAIPFCVYRCAVTVQSTLHQTTLVVTIAFITTKVQKRWHVAMTKYTTLTNKLAVEGKSHQWQILAQPAAVETRHITSMKSNAVNQK